MARNSKWLIFVIVAIAQFMVVLDSSITNVALPVIGQSLHFGENTLQWVVTAYALTFGGFLLLGGRAADKIGRRLVLQIGIGGFTLASLLIGVSHSAVLLIVLRAIQGLAAGFMSPAALSIVLSAFGEGKERNRAFSFWSMISTGGAAVGLVLGGALTQFTNWRWNFFINVPVGIALSLLVPRYVPEHEKEDSDHKLDMPGAVLVTAGLMALVFAFSQAPTWGWDSFGVLGTLGLSVVLLVGFVLNEARVRHPLMPLSFFKIRNVSGGNLVMMPVFAGMTGTFFLTSLYLQSVLHYSPFITGLSFLPFPLTVATIASQMPKVVGRFGFKPFMIIGPLLVALGSLLLVRLPVHGTYLANVLPSLLIMPIGMGLTFMPTFVAATSGVKPQESGLASGIMNTSQQIGAAIGLAILSGAATSATQANIHLGAAAALVKGYDHAFLVAAIFMIAASLLAATVITQPHRAASSKRQAHNQPERALGLD